MYANIEVVSNMERIQKENKHELVKEKVPGSRLISRNEGEI